jgi:hypothetical protein
MATMPQPQTTLDAFETQATRVGATVHRALAGAAVTVRVARDAGVRTIERRDRAIQGALSPSTTPGCSRSFSGWAHWPGRSSC